MVKSQRDEMGGACSRQVTKFWYETLKEGDRLEDLDYDGGIISPVKN
jgi:hypothetical protein